MACALISILVPRTNAVELKSETVAAFDRYINATQQRMASDLRNGRFFLIDDFPEARQRAYIRLQQGETYIQPVYTKEDGKPIQVPDGLIHHWVGLAFIPGSTLSRTLAILQDYDNHEKIYKPDVRKSKLLRHEGNEFTVYLQLYRKSLVTVVVNMNLDVQYTLLSTKRAMSKAHSTRIAEVENVGKSNERELPVGNDHGYIWRLNNYWRIEERDGGVYIQVESVGLSRSVPWTVAWLVNPLIRSIPKRVLSQLLNATRIAVAHATQSRTNSSAFGKFLAHECSRKPVSMVTLRNRQVSFLTCGRN